MVKLTTNKIYILVVSLYFILSFFAVRKMFSLSGVISGNDWGIPPLREQLLNAFQVFQFTWFHGSNLVGSEVLQASKVRLNFYFLTYILSFFGLDGVLISKLLLLFSIFFSGLFIYILLRYLKCNNFGAILGGIVYMFTPFAFNASVLAGGSLLLVYTIIPLTFYLFLKSIYSESWFKYLFFLSILFSVWIQIAMTGYILFVFFSLFLIINSHLDKKIFGRVFYSLCIPGILYILLQAFWTISLFTHASISYATGAIPYQLNAHVEISLFDFIRGLGFWAPYYEQTIIQHNILLICVSILIPIIAFFSFLIIRKDPIINFFTSFALFLIFITSFDVVLYFITKNLFFFGIFRDFTSIFILLSVSYIILIGKILSWAFDIFINKIKGNINIYERTTLAIILFGLIIVPVTIYSIPFIYTGDLSGNLKTLDITNQYNPVNNWVNDQNMLNKVLWLPTGSGYVTEENSDINWHSDYYAIFSKIPGGFLDSNYRYLSIPDYWIDDLLYEDSSPNLGKIAGLLNIKYIILRTHEEVTQWATVSGAISERRTEELENTLSNQKDLKRIYNVNNVSIYINKGSLPLIYTTNSSILVTGELDLLNNFADSNFDFNNISIIFANQQNNPRIIGFSNSILSNNNTYLDLLTPLNVSQYSYEPGNFVKSQDVINDWSSLHQLYWWYNSDYQAGLENCAFTRGSDVTLTIPINVETETNYSMYLKYYAGQNTSLLKINVDNITSFISTKDSVNRGYVWKKINTYPLKKGTYDLKITSYGENTIAKILIIPDYILADRLSNIDTLIHGKYIGYDNLNEGDSNFANMSDNLKMENCFEETIKRTSNNRQYMINNNEYINYTFSDNILSKPIVHFNMVNPTKYHIIINATHSFVLVFSESYDPQWKIYTNNNHAPINEISANYTLVNVQEAAQEMQFTPSDVSYLLEKPLPEDNHFLVNGYANAWYIDPSQLPKDADGNIDITLYFLPQSLFYLGLIISGTTLVTCIGYLVYDWNRGRRKKETKPEE